MSGVTASSAPVAAAEADPSTVVEATGQDLNAAERGESPFVNAKDKDRKSMDITDSKNRRSSTAGQAFDIE